MSDSCPLSAFRIASIVVEGQNLTERDYIEQVYLRYDGKLIVTTDEILENWLVYIEAFNSFSWGGARDYFVDLSTIPPSESLAKFESAVSDVEIELDVSN